jgi:hypothetical protein
MTLEEKLTDSIERSEKLMPAAVWAQVKQLLTPEALSLMAGVTGAWAVSHFYGVGEVADIVLLVVGGAVMGLSAVDVAREMLAFARGANNAQDEKALDEAASHFARAVAIGGVTLIAGMLFKSRPKVFREPLFGGPARVRSLPRGPGWRYKPTEKLAPIPGRYGKTTIGITDEVGNITVELTLPPGKIQETLLHERVHQFLTPKFYFMREVRINAALGGYNRSYLLRYLEEALAETYALVRTKGLGSTFEGISFPVKAGYVTVAKMGHELTGILLGSINVSGNTYRVTVAAGIKQ